MYLKNNDPREWAGALLLEPVIDPRSGELIADFGEWVTQAQAEQICALPPSSWEVVAHPDLSKLVVTRDLTLEAVYCRLWLLFPTLGSLILQAIWTDISGLSLKAQIEELNWAHHQLGRQA